MIGHCAFCYSIGPLSDFEGQWLCEYCYDECVAMDEQMKEWYEEDQLLSDEIYFGDAS